MTEDLPPTPFTDLMAAMHAMHEYLLSAMEAGFTRDEAFKLVVEVMRENIGK